MSDRKLEKWQAGWMRACKEGDALVFATDVLGFLMPGEVNAEKKPQLEPWQVDALGRFSRHWRDRFEKRGRLSIRSGHGVGKTTLLCICILFVLFCGGPDTKIPVVGNSQDQLRDGLWAELSKWINHLPPALKAQIDWQKERVSMKCAPEEAFAVRRTATKHRPEALQGIHAKNVLAVLEEASGIPEETIEAGAGTLSTPGALAIAAGNPTRASGFFHKTHTALRASWDCMVVNSEDVPRARGHIDDIIQLYGKDSNKYRVRVLGEFPTQDDDTVIPLSLVEAARKREVRPLEYWPIWGSDVARFGDDRTTLCKRAANVLLEAPKVWSNLDTTQVAGKIFAEYEATKVSMRPKAICIDSIGYGAGVVDQLSRMMRAAGNDCNVVGVNVAESSSSFDEFHRLRDELWFKGRRWFEQRDCTLPEGCEGLIAELTTPTYDFTVTGRKVVESKADMKKRGLQSPDEADGFLLTFATIPQPRKPERDYRDGGHAGRSGWTG